MPTSPPEEVTNSPETLIKKVHSVGSMWASTPTRIIETLVQIKYYVNHFEKRIFMDYTAVVITVSDLGSQGKRIDTSGPAVCKMIEDAGFHVIHTAIIPDEQAEIQKMLIYCADELHANLILTTGRHGPFSARCDARGHACRAGSRNPRNPRCDVGREPQDYAARHALPRRRRNER